MSPAPPHAASPAPAPALDPQADPGQEGQEGGGQGIRGQPQKGGRQYLQLQQG